MHDFGDVDHLKRLFVDSFVDVDRLWLVIGRRFRPICDRLDLNDGLLVFLLGNNLLC